VENVTPELFIHLLSCILFESRYGAQTTTLSSNIKNHILGFGLAKFEQPVNSFSISANWKEGTEVNFENVKTAIDNAMSVAYGKKNYKLADKIVEYINSLWANDNKKELTELYEKAKKECEKFLKEIKVCK